MHGIPTRDTLGEGSSTGTIRQGTSTQLPDANLTMDEELAFIASIIRSPSPSGNTAPHQSSETQNTSTPARETTSARTDTTTHSSRPHTQQVPLDPDTTVSPSNSPRAGPRGSTSSQQLDSPARPSTGSSGVLSQQSRDSGTIPASFPHETVPSILPSPPPSTRAPVVTSTTATTRTGTLNTASSPTPGRTIQSAHNDAQGTPLKVSSGTSSDSTRSAQSPITSRFEFGKVVHESPRDKSLTDHQAGTSTSTNAQGPAAGTSNKDEQDLSKRVQAAVGYPIGRTAADETPTRPLKRKSEGEDELERERAQGRMAAAGVRFGFGQSPAQIRGRGRGK